MNRELVNAGQRIAAVALHISQSFTTDFHAGTTQASTAFHESRDHESRITRSHHASRRNYCLQHCRADHGAGALAAE